MATTATGISMEQFLNTSYKPVREYIDGETREKGITGRSHENVRNNLLTFLLPKQKSWGVKFYVELFTRVSATRIRMPDVSLVRDPVWDGEVLVSVPEMVIEILSPTNTLREISERVSDYLQFGVPKIYVLDPFDKVGYSCVGSTFDQWRRVSALEVDAAQNVFIDLGIIF